MSKHLIYQVLPRLWGEGRFSSLDQESLQWIKESLGMDCIWLTGVIRHATSATEKVVKGEAGSPYAITDYYDVNPYLAENPSRRMQEFQALVKRCHQAGLKVLIDFVPNHVAREYSGAKTPKGEQRLGGADDVSRHWSQENDFFYYPGEPLHLPVDAGGYQEYPAKASGNAFTAYPSVNDWYETVKLNYCEFHTGTWDRMLAILRFWAGKGVDGFRCDMVELVPPQFMAWAISHIKEEYPGTMFVAEVYEKEKYRMYLEEVGFDLLYDKSGLYDTVRAVMTSGCPAWELTNNWKFLGDMQPGMLCFLENHDEQRVASDFFAGSAENGYAALAVSLLLNDASFMLYSGQEVGERGMDNEPFSGVNGRTSIFDWWKVQSLQRLWRAIHGQRPGLQSHEKKVLERYSEVLKSAGKTLFKEGKTYDLCYCQDECFDHSRHFAFMRSTGRETALVIANFGATSEVKVKIPWHAVQFLETGFPAMEISLTVPSNDFTVVYL